MSYMLEGKLHRSTLQREGGMVMFIAIFMVLTVANSDVSDTNLFPHFLPLTVGTWAVDGKLTTFSLPIIIFRGQMEEYAREPCPWRIIDDCGGAFSMGLIGVDLHPDCTDLSRVQLIFRWWFLQHAGRCLQCPGWLPEEVAGRDHQGEGEVGAHCPL